MSRLLQIITILFALLIADISYAQDGPDYRITISDNIRISPKSLNTTFPLVRLSKNPNEKMMTGGYGVGISRFFKINSSFDLKASANFSRQVYWNEPTMFNKGPNAGDYLGVATFASKEYYFNPSGIVHYNFGKGFSTGLGIGFQVLLSSVTDVNQSGVFANSGIAVQNPRNRQYKPVMPVVPLEISWKGKLMLFSLRGEAGLLNRYRSDLAEYGSSGYAMLTFEVGMKIFKK